ncbi:MAG: MFS transporter [Clostridia bacterium]
MNLIKTTIKELRNFLILWSTQSLSALGSSMTNYALVIWSYQEKGSALTTSLLSVCSYAPYVLMSIFAGAFSDKWNKKITMLVSDSFAAACTALILLLFRTGSLRVWHLYFLNALNGLMNTIQQPASDVAISLITPKRHYQKVSGLRSFSSSLVTILTPVLAMAVLPLAGLRAVIWFDLATFAAAFLSLAFVVKIPDVPSERTGRKESVLESVQGGLRYLKEQRGVLHLILFLAAINFTASVYQAAIPAMLLSRNGGGENALGLLNAASGAAMLLGSVLASVLPAPKSRVRVICNMLLFAMGTENFILAFGRSVPIWCVGAILGWIGIPLMNANMDVLFRSHIPLPMQGRVYSARNTLQFFTIPVGYFVGGILVDKVFEPFMAALPPQSIWHVLFGSGKGSGAAMLFLVLGITGTATCLFFRKDHNIWDLENRSDKSA